MAFGADGANQPNLWPLKGARWDVIRQHLDILKR